MSNRKGKRSKVISPQKHIIGNNHLNNSLNDVLKSSAMKEQEEDFKKTKEEVLFTGKNEIARNIESYAEDARKYNETIGDNIDELYKNFIPLNKILCRVYARNVKEAGVSKFIYQEMHPLDEVEIQVRGGSGNKYTQNTVETPFKFQPKAYVVSVPENEKVFKAGDVISIPYPITSAQRIGSGSFLSYGGAFVHPDSDLVIPVQNINSPHYGWALVDGHSILGKIK